MAQNSTSVNRGGLGGAFGEFFRETSDDVTGYARGAAAIPGIVTEYVEETPLEQIGEDVVTTAKAMGQAIADDPLTFIAESMPIYGQYVAFRDSQNFLDEAEKLRSQGQLDKAEEMEAMATFALAGAIPGGNALKRARQGIMGVSPIPDNERNGFPIPEPGTSFKSDIGNVPAPPQPMGLDQFEKFLAGKNLKKADMEAALSAAKNSLVEGKKGKMQVDAQLFKDNLAEFDPSRDMYVTSKPTSVSASYDNPENGLDGGSNFGNMRVISMFKGPKSSQAATVMTHSGIDNLLGPSLGNRLDALRGYAGGVEEFDFVAEDISITPNDLKRAFKEDNLGQPEVYTTAVERILDDPSFTRQLEDSVAVRRIKHLHQNIFKDELVPELNDRLEQVFDYALGESQGPDIIFPMFSRGFGLTPEEAARLTVHAERNGLSTMKDFVDSSVDYLEQMDMQLDNPNPTMVKSSFEQLKDLSSDLVPSMTGREFKQIYNNQVEQLRNQPEYATDIYDLRLAANKVLEGLNGYSMNIDFEDRWRGEVEFGDSKVTGRTLDRDADVTADTRNQLMNDAVPDDPSTSGPIPGRDIVEHSEFVPSNEYARKNFIGFARTTDNFVLQNPRLQFTEADIGTDIDVPQTEIPRDYIRNRSLEVDTTYTGPTADDAVVLKARHTSEYQPDPRGDAMRIGTQKEVEQGQKININYRTLDDDARQERDLADMRNDRVFYEQSLLRLKEIADNKEVLLDNKNPNIKRLANRLHIEAVAPDMRRKYLAAAGDRSNINEDLSPASGLLLRELGKGIDSQYTRDLKTVKEGFEEFEALMENDISNLNVKSVYDKFIGKSDAGDLGALDAEIARLTRMRNEDPQLFEDIDGQDRLDTLLNQEVDSRFTPSEFFQALSRLERHITNPNKRRGDREIAAEGVADYFGDRRLIEREAQDIERDLFLNTDPDVQRRLAGGRQDNPGRMVMGSLLRSNAGELLQDYYAYQSNPSGINEVFPGYAYNAAETQKKQVKGAILDAIRTDDAQAITSPGIRKLERPDWDPNGPDDEAINPRYMYQSPNSGGLGGAGNEQLKPDAYRQMHEIHKSVVKELNKDLKKAGIKGQFYADIAATGRIDMRTASRDPRNIGAEPREQTPVKLRVRPIIRWDKEAGDFYKGKPLPFRVGGLVTIPGKQYEPGIEAVIKKYRREGTMTDWL